MSASGSTQRQRSKNKRPDNRPARARYWAAKKLEVSKVHNLVRCNAMNEKEALLFWRNARKGRVKK